MTAQSPSRVCRPRGVQHAGNAAQLARDLRTCLATGAEPPVLDLAAVPMMTAAALREVLILAQRLHPNETLEVRHVNPAMRRLLRLSGLAWFLREARSQGGPP